MRAAKRVKGVHAIADDIEVEPTGTSGCTDHDLAELAEQALDSNISVPDTVRATVQDGILTVDGTVDWDYKRRAAVRAVEYLTGVHNVIKDVSLMHASSAHDIHERIATAIRRSAEVDAANICVTSDAGHVTLTGSVSSWAERERAQHPALSTPGVSEVTRQARDLLRHRP